MKYKREDRNRLAADLVANRVLIVSQNAVSVISGDIALRAFAGHRLFAMAAPTGGTILIAAWLALAAAAVVALARS
jgi:uncharacterized membrane protein YgdD (TMEM256/DUF423 family)